MMIDMEITIATKKDAKVICEHNISMAKETENINLSPKIALKAVEQLINDSSKGFYVLARIDDEIIGQLMITYEWSDWRNNTIWWIQSVYVKPSYRKKGVFESLYSYVKDLAKKQQVTLIRLYVHHENTSAIEVYKKLEMRTANYLMFETTVE